MLQDVYSGSGYLLAQKDISVAVSEPRTQQLIDTDYRKIKRTRVRGYLANIGKSSHSPDILDTAHLVEEGDELLIRLSDLSIVSYIVPVGAISPVDHASLVPTMVSDTLPFGNVVTNVTDGRYAFDHLSSATPNMGVNYYVGYQFYGGVPTAVYSFYAKQQHSRDINFVIEGSTNGLDYFIISTHNSARYDLLAGHTWDIDTPGLYSYYRFKVTSGSCEIQELRFLGDGIEVDTTSATNGDVPSLCFSMNDEVKINEQTLVEDVPKRSIQYGESSDRIHLYSQFEDCTFYPSREIVTTYNFKTAGNLMIEHTGEIYDLWLKQGNATHTDNTTPENTVTWNGTGGAGAADAYKIFDGGTAATAFSEATGALGVCDIEHIYEFDTAKTCYAIEMTTAGYHQAPAEYTVSVSNDGVAYTEVLHIIQAIAANDLTLTKYFEITSYADYKYYKIHITKGNEENGVCSAKQYVLLEEDPS